MMEKQIKLLRSPFQMFLIVAVSIVIIVTVLYGLITSSIIGATLGFFIGLMIGVSVGVAAGFLQAIKNGKTIAKMKNQEYYLLRKK